MSTTDLIGVLETGDARRLGAPDNPRRTIRIQKNTDWRVRFAAVLPGGAPVDLTPVILALTVKKHPNGSPVISRIGLPVPGEPTNRKDFTGVPLDTRDVADGRYTFDVRGKFQGKWETLVGLSPWLIEPSDGEPDAPLTAVSPVVFYYALPPLIATFDFIGPHIFELGDTLLNPSFLASYNRPPSAASISDGAVTAVLAPPFTAGVLAFPYSFPTINAQQDFTLTAMETGGPNLTSVVSAKWQPRVFWDSSSSAGPYNEAFIEALVNSALLPSRVLSPGYAAGAGQFLFYSVPTAYGGAPENFIDHATGFAVGMSKVAAAVNVTNAFGVTVPYDVWKSDIAGLGAITVDVV
jgi:hypothetical protein